MRKYKGKNMSEWARLIGISPSAMKKRVDQWGWDKAVSVKANYPSAPELDHDHINKSYNE